MMLRLPPKLLAVLTAVACMAPVGSVLAGERGGERLTISDDEDSTTDSGLAFYGKSYAVVIGINQYQHLPKLSGAVRDGERIQEVLKERGFEVKAFFNKKATRQNILEYLRDDLSNLVERDDRVVIYFAGHGISKERPMGHQ